jgi:hypothetical protein
VACASRCGGRRLGDRVERISPRPDAGAYAGPRNENSAATGVPDLPRRPSAAPRPADRVRCRVYARNSSTGAPIRLAAAGQFPADADWTSPERLRNGISAPAPLAPGPPSAGTSVAIPAVSPGFRCSREARGRLSATRVGVPAPSPSGVDEDGSPGPHEPLRALASGVTCRDVRFARAVTLSRSRA